MASIDPNDMLGTDELTFGEWWTWVQQFSRAISQGSTRIGLGIISGGFAIAGASLFNSQAGADYGKVMLGASGVFALWFAGSVIASTVKGR